MLNWLQQWYLSQCDEEWEHEYGVKIETLDNPGWSIKIDLKYTALEDVRIKIPMIEHSKNDWYTINVMDAVFIGLCSPTNLNFVLEEFKLLFQLGETKYIANRPQATIIPFSEGYSLSNGFPKSIREELYHLIDENNISSLNMHEKGEFLAAMVKPTLENLTATPITDMKALITLIYLDSWNYINSKGSDS